MDVEFKVRVKDLLDPYSIVTILAMFCWVIMMFTNNFQCEVLAMFVQKISQ